MNSKRSKFLRRVARFQLDIFKGTTGTEKELLKRTKKNDTTLNHLQKAQIHALKDKPTMP